MMVIIAYYAIMIKCHLGANTKIIVTGKDSTNTQLVCGHQKLLMQSHQRMNMDCIQLLCFQKFFIDALIYSFCIDIYVCNSLIQRNRKWIDDFKTTNSVPLFSILDFRFLRKDTYFTWPEQGHFISLFHLLQHQVRTVFCQSTSSIRWKPK